MRSVAQGRSHWKRQSGCRTCTWATLHEPPSFLQQVRHSLVIGHTTGADHPQASQVPA